MARQGSVPIIAIIVFIIDDYSVLCNVGSCNRQAGRVGGDTDRNRRPGTAIGPDCSARDQRRKEMRHAEDSQACIRAALRRRRRTLGLTQDDTAALLGLSRMTYHRIETGIRRIRFAELAVICSAFNCHIGELVQDGELASAYTHAAKAILGEASP
jgi:DNA-binding XRE family transcriptional regulator